MGDISRLPKWARSEIELLRRRVTETQVALDETRNPASCQGTDTWMVDSIHGDQLLPYGATVRFRLEDGEVECNALNGMLHVAATGLRSYRLVVRPAATNVVEIATDELQTIIVGVLYRGETINCTKGRSDERIPQDPDRIQA